MRLLDSLRDAEKRGMSSVRKQVERAREEWDDMERRIRQRMRIYPQKLRTKLSTRSQASQPETRDRGMAATAVATDTEPVKPIISIHGRDLPPEDIDDSAA